MQVVLSQTQYGFQIRGETIILWEEMIWIELLSLKKIASKN
jgi:hypothetical protein